MQSNDLHEWLSSRAAGFFSWLSAFLGIGTFMGFINTVIGVMSAIYLVLQIWNYFAHTRVKNKLELEMLRQQVADHRAGLGK
jgi:hypothetical protein